MKIMTLSTRLSTLLLSLALSNFTLAETKQEKTVKAVETRVEQLRQAMVNGDGKMLTDLSAKELSYGHSGGHIEGQEEFVDKIATRKSNFVSAEFQNQTISVVDNVAIVRHILAAHTRDKGEDKDISIGIMMIWQNQHGKWKMLARQAYKLPTEAH